MIEPIAPDPDAFVRQHGAPAMQAVIDGAVPLRAYLLWGLLARGECPDPKVRERAYARWCLGVDDLIELAASILALAAQTQNMLRDEAEDRGVALQRSTIALAARGLVAPSKLDRVPIEVFFGATEARAIAWLCACRACRALGRRASFVAARHELDAMPLDLPRPIAIDLLCEAREELDRAEDIERPDVDAIARLLMHHRAHRTHEWLIPVFAALHEGSPLIDTAARLREAAEIFEGRKERSR